MSCESDICSEKLTGSASEPVFSSLCITVFTLLSERAVRVDAMDKFGLVSGLIEVIGVTGSKRLEERDWSTARDSSSELTVNDFPPFSEFPGANDFSVLVPKLVVAIDGDISEPELTSGSDFIVGCVGVFDITADFS